MRKNRRGYFRIYDEVNLSYKKIDEKWVTDPHLISDNVFNDHSFSTDIENILQDTTSLLPGSEDLQFNEHESQNVNISASGMAFYCEDALEAGDFLVIKIKPASSMAVIITYSQVVYCKHLQSEDSPNDSPHPCFVGAHFIDMKDEDRDLLIKHVDKKRKQQNWVHGLFLAAVITVIAFPDVVFGLLFEFFHFLFELFLHILHLSFEFIELNLDRLVEHFFSTDLHQTQVIVFYIILSFIVYGLYLLGRRVPSFCRRCKRNLFTAYAFKKASLLFFWREQSLINKIKIMSIVIAAITCYILFGM
ncbi:PilZ domain-containing protein [Methylobacter sp.]|uniref:PilZ domain-containing protein n=1 Tax=Methylobacter sp. TaxID=2051955 RepID=UPI0025D07AA4|nr:PilZ domain-containing protein [Methylobacter sp.]